MNKGEETVDSTNNQIKFSPLRRRKYSDPLSSVSTQNQTVGSAMSENSVSENKLTLNISGGEHYKFTSLQGFDEDNYAEFPDKSTDSSLNTSFEMKPLLVNSTDDDGDEYDDQEDAKLISKAFRKADGSGKLDSIDEGIEAKIIEEETFWSIYVQVFIPFLIAGLGMVGAGVVLDIVQHWPVFMKVPEVFILVPALLGLKGNLEMTLASRLSTQANLGNLDSTKSKWQMTLGNLSLVQCQAIVIGFLASVSAVILGWIPDGHFDINHALILCTSSVMTASIASFCLGLIMVTVVLVSRYLSINPDNVATPIAASLGDLTTLSLLATISNAIHDAIESYTWLAPVILGIYLVSMSLWVHLAKQNELTEKVLYTGWTPVLSAMVISSCGGLILDYTVKVFKGIAVFQPVISGVGGNLVAVQASRLSTFLHASSHLGTLPESTPKVCINPMGTFFSKGRHAMTARALVMMVIPGHVIFSYVISYIQAGHTSITIVFLFFYLLAALIQVIILLYIAEVLIFYLWKLAIDPDNSAIPYLTAAGDLIGTALLAIAFHFLYWIGDKDSDLGD